MRPLETLAVAFNPLVAPATLDPRLDVVIGTAATLVTAAATLLAWGRFREGREVAALFRGSAFAVLFVFTAVGVVAYLVTIALAFNLQHLFRLTPQEVYTGRWILLIIGLNALIFS